MNEGKCFWYGEKIDKQDRANHEYTYDDDGNLWRMPCAKKNLIRGRLTNYALKCFNL